MEQDGFRDRNHRYGFLVARENARRLVEDPAVLARGREHLDRFSRDDPHQADGYRVWDALLLGFASVVASRLTERSPGGDYIRETAPSFGGLPNAMRVRLLREARVPLVDAMGGGADVREDP